MVKKKKKITGAGAVKIQLPLIDYGVMAGQINVFLGGVHASAMNLNHSHRHGK